jgi:hypothetical protein
VVDHDVEHPGCEGVDDLRFGLEEIAAALVLSEHTVTLGHCSSRDQCEHGQEFASIRLMLVRDMSFKQNCLHRRNFNNVVRQ